MSATKAKPATGAPKSSKKSASDTPSLFRLNIEVGDLDKADAFYARLLGLEGRKQAGSRVYFQAGPVTLQVVNVSPSRPHTAAKALYFIVEDLDAVHARAKALGCLSRELVHGKPGGDLVTRPWG